MNLDEREIQEFRVVDPPAGVDNLFTVPTGYWKVLSIYFKLICSSTVATRQPSIIVRSQPTTVPIVSEYTASTLTASQSGLHSFGPALANQGINSSNLVKTLGSLPSPLILKGGDTIETATDNMQNNDQITLFMVRLQRLGS